MRLMPFLLTTLIAVTVAVGCQDSGSRTPSRTTGSADATGAAGNFVFTAAGDYGSSKDTTATLDLIARSEASFNLALGDLSYTDAPESDWCDYVHSKVGERFPFQFLSRKLKGNTVY
jgi:hypothetical protein